ncbi:MAG: hypothetical protein E6Q36_01200 [Chryseobacterium sp.]|nr:MAG: hypothetical protein E6Q36_01200 [Chryseobacterium sp.]
MNAEPIKLNLLEQNKGQISGVPKNPRTIRNAKFDLTVKSIKEDPEMLELRELIVFKQAGKYVVICGNTRLAALKKLGYKEAYCKILPENTPAEKLRAYAIKDNVSAGDWDFGDLEENWEKEELIDFGIDGYNFSTDAELLSIPDNSEEEDPTDLQARQKATPKITDVGFVRFEVVISEEQKTNLISVLNLIKSKYDCTIGEALNHLVLNYKN